MNQDDRRASGQLLDISPSTEIKTLVEIFGTPTTAVTNGVSTDASSNGEPAVDNYPEVLKYVS